MENSLPVRHDVVACAVLINSVALGVETAMLFSN